MDINSENWNNNFKDDASYDEDEFLWDLFEDEDDDDDDD